MTPFGRYQLIKKLATGGMAEVFLALQPLGVGDDGRHVVVKRILPHLADDPEYLKMFQNEARLAAQFSHPNIAQIFEYGHEAGRWFIAMEFIHGEDLGRLMRQAWATQQWIAAPLALRIVASACEALHYAHQRGVVHRDISPQNIMISFDGSVKVVDFGIARVNTDSSQSTSGGIKGKFAYMAPEQAASQPLDARTDVFALGLVLYELLTGVRPLKRDTDIATLLAATECAIEPPSVVVEMGPDLDAVVMRALAKSPADRYPDARALLLALEQHLATNQLIATSVQISELMRTLFAGRLAEEKAAGAPRPVEADATDALPVTQQERPETSTAPRTPKRRKTARTSSNTSMPVAPPRNVGPKKTKDRSWATPEKKPEASPPPQRGSPVWLVAVLLIAALGGGGGWWWWSHRTRTVKISVDTQPPTTVRVLTKQGEARDLGPTPLTRVEVQRDDRLVLESSDACIRYELEVPQDDAPYPFISKSFEKGKLKVTVISAKPLTVRCFGHTVGTVPGTLTLYEGTPPLEVAGVPPVPQNVTVVPDTTTPVTFQLAR